MCNYCAIARNNILLFISRLGLRVVIILHYYYWFFFFFNLHLHVLFANNNERFNESNKYCSRRYTLHVTRSNNIVSIYYLSIIYFRRSIILFHISSISIVRHRRRAQFAVAHVYRFLYSSTVRFHILIYVLIYMFQCIFLLWYQGHWEVAAAADNFFHVTTMQCTIHTILYHTSAIIIFSIIITVMSVWRMVAPCEKPLL